MLGRTAAHMFWISRYMERADYVARLLDAGCRMSLTPGLDAGHRDQWRSVLDAAALGATFFETHDQADLATVVDFMLFDPDNPSSVRNCLRRARTDARTERIAITKDIWEALNSTWLEYSEIKAGSMTSNRLPDLLEWIKAASNQFRGALLGTILRNEGYLYSQLGCFIERADNTARLLDVKYYVLLPRADMIGGDIDTHHWEMILRAVSAYRSYRHVYHGPLTAWNVADYLILKAIMPRSLCYSYGQISTTFGELEQLCGEQTVCHDIASETLGLFDQSDVQSLIDTGLHEFLQDFISKNNRLAAMIADKYNFY